MAAGWSAAGLDVTVLERVEAQPGPPDVPVGDELEAVDVSDDFAELEGEGGQEDEGGEAEERDSLDEREDDLDEDEPVQDPDDSSPRVSS